MKRMIRASETDEVIFEDEYFDFIRINGVGINNTPWEGLAVRSKGLADKHVVEVRLNQIGHPDYNGELIKHEYSGAVVAHGMRSVIDTLSDTAEYIDVLEDALDFAIRVNDWLSKNQ